MKLTISLLPIALIVLMLAGCVEDKPAPRLDSSDHNERIEAVHDAQNRYGVRVKPAENKAAVLPEFRLDDANSLPIDGRWILIGRKGEQHVEAAVTIQNGVLRSPAASLYWKNIRRVPNAPSRYFAVRVSPGILWGTREDPVEFYLDADGILHQDDTQLPAMFRSVGIITLRRP